MIDAHVHYLPPSVAVDLPGLAVREPYWGYLLNPPGGKSIQGFADVDAMLAAMDGAGVERAVIVGEYFQNHESCVNRNSRVIELLRQHSDRLLALAAVQPLAGAAAAAELERCREAGMVGVGELNPYAQGFRLDGRPFLDLAAWCVEANWPINLHVNEEVGGFYPGKSPTPLRHFYELAGRLPDLKLILAHWGGGLFFYELMPAVRRQLANVWYDTAATPLQYPVKRIFPVALQCVDHRKILFGSDYPLRLYPHRHKTPEMRTLVEEIQALSLPEPIFQDLMGGNAARVLDGAAPASKTPIAPSGPAADSRAGRPAPVSLALPIALLAAENPAVADLLARQGFTWEDSPRPGWEPLVQAAAARGYSPQERQALLEEIRRLMAEETTDDSE